MKASVAGVVVAALVSTAAPLAAAGGAPGVGPALPRVLTCAGKAVVRPTRYVLACADANTYFEAIHWKTWTRTLARATAVFVENTCTPTCAEGRFATHPATLALSEAKQTRYGLLFSVAHYRYRLAGTATLPLEPLSAVSAPAARPRCSADPGVAARFVIPPAPFLVRGVAVTRAPMPAPEPVDGGPSHKRLYAVRFFVVRGNAVLAAGRAYTQFAYVARPGPGTPWCYLKGGSGP